MELPEVTFFEDFYFWFNTDTKKEYYATPLYFYKADFHLDYDNKVRDVYYKETEVTDNGLKHPASLYFPFHEKLGMLLLRFLNADLSNFETANKTFFYAYGFEILRDLDKNYKFELKQNYGSNEEYLKQTTKIFEDLKENLLDLQKELINAVTYIYNLDNDKNLEKYTYPERFAVYLIKRMGKLYTYYKNDFIMRDSYSRKYQEIGSNSEYDLLETLQNKNQVLSMSDTHKSNDLSSICYAILEELSKTPNYPIKKCQNCGMYFIPNAKSDEIYCDYPKENSKTCRELGAFQSYTERLKQNKAMGEYRRTYQQKFMQVRKDKENKKLAKDFESWKKQAKAKINDMKKGKLTENEVYEWIKFRK
ncbi:MAG: hypothetical protein ILA02_03180 [Clostridia bacterium]|nr:hypothetical protein [Clostridia bacterium]